MNCIDAVPYIPRYGSLKSEPGGSQRKSKLAHPEPKITMDEKRLFFALSTGVRMREIFTLTWHNVDLVNRVATVTNENAKSGKTRALLLNHDAMELIRKLRFRDSCEYVFTL
jgi:integrase